MLILAYMLGTYAIFTATSPCAGVIGVIYNQQGIVRDVYHNSPAEQAGIKVNDIILKRHSTRGKPGTVAIVKHIRDGELRTTNVNRICVSDLEGRTW